MAHKLVLFNKCLPKRLRILIKIYLRYVVKWRPVMYLGIRICLCLTGLGSDGMFIALRSLAPVDRLNPWLCGCACGWITVLNFNRP